MWRKLLVAWMWMVGVHAMAPSIVLGQTATTIVNENSSTSGYIYSWTSRNTDRAIAFRVFNDGGVLRGVFRQYLLVDVDGEKSFDAKQTVLQFGSTALPAQKAIAFTLTDYPGKPGSYTINYDLAGVAKELGWVRFTAGHGDRKSSDVVIRLKRDVVLPPVAVTTDPCTGPPADDIGEEELIASSNVAGEGNVPGKSINFKPLSTSTGPTTATTSTPAP